MDISKLLTSRYVEVTYLDTPDVDGRYIRMLREKHGLSQAALTNLVKLLVEKPELAGYVRKVEIKQWRRQHAPAIAYIRSFCGPR